MGESMFASIQSSHALAFVALAANSAVPNLCWRLGGGKALRHWGNP